MANEEHLAILRQGVEVWNAWREEHPGIRPNLYMADLSGVDLPGVYFTGADLAGTDLTNANLTNANLTRAFPIKADLTGAKLRGASLTRADLTRASLAGADLTRASLAGADLTNANLAGAFLAGVDFTSANLIGTDLAEADMRKAIVRDTIFAAVDLSTVQGLDAVTHWSSSHISIDTLYFSQGDIPESFLRGCGVPDSMIEYARSLVTAQRPIDYYSCFISYSSQDEAVAQRLHADLQARGVRCWFAPHDLEIGVPIVRGIDEAIRIYDKLLIILSAASVKSHWVEFEVNQALHRELEQGRTMLFPIRLDDTVLNTPSGWAAQLRSRNIGDFRAWKDHDSYQAAFTRLLRDLKAKEGDEPRK